MFSSQLRSSLAAQQSSAKLIADGTDQQRLEALTSFGFGLRPVEELLVTAESDRRKVWTPSERARVLATLEKLSYIREAEVPRDALMECLDKIKLKSLVQDEYVFSQGDLNRSVYIVLSGQIHFCEPANKVRPAALGSSGESEQALSSTRRFVRWINQVASTEDTGALRRLPWSWSSDALALPPAQETPGTIRWSSNAFVHSVDPATDLPCLTGTALQGAAGCSSLDALLLHEYEEFVEPILNQHARESSDTIEHLPRVKQHLRSSKLAATLREVRTRMQATMPPLELAAGYEPEAKLRRQAQTADALEAAALVTESTIVRRREGVRVLVEHDPMAWSTIQLRANVPGTKWPQDVHARWATPVTWALSTFGGAAGGSFRAQELYAAVRECSWGSACAIRERETALHVVRWLVGLRLVQVVSEE